MASINSRLDLLGLRIALHRQITDAAALLAQLSELPNREAHKTSNKSPQLIADIPRLSQIIPPPLRPRLMKKLFFAVALTLTTTLTAIAAPPTTFTEAKIIAKQKIYFDQANSSVGDL